MLMEAVPHQGLLQRMSKDRIKLSAVQGPSALQMRRQLLGLAHHRLAVLSHKPG